MINKLAVNTSFFRKYELSIPKLSLKASYSLIENLTEIGMKNMFTNEANFTGITDEEIYISEVRKLTANCR